MLSTESTTLSQPQGSGPSRNGRQFKHDAQVLLQIGDKGPGITCTSSVPFRAQPIWHNSKIGRMITPQPKPQGNMPASEGRQQAKQFPGDSV